MPISIRARAVSWRNVSSVLLMGLAAHGCTGAIEGQDQEQRRPPFGANAAEATGSRAPGSQPNPPQAALPPASLPPAQMPPVAVPPGRPVDPPQSLVPSCPAGGLVNPAGRTQRLEPAQLNETFRLFGYSVSSVLPNPGIVDHLQDSETSYRVDEIEAIDRVASMPLPSFETRYTKRLTDCSASADASACLAKTWSQVASDLWGIAPLDHGADAAAEHLSIEKQFGAATARSFVLRAIATDPEFLFIQRPTVIKDARGLAQFKRWASYILTGTTTAVIADGKATKATTAAEFVTALLAKSDFSQTVHKFYRNFLRLDNPAGLIKYGKDLAFYTIQFAHGVTTDFHKHVLSVVGQPQASLTSVLFAPVVLEGTMGTIFAAAEPASTTAYGDSATERLGIFTHPALLGSLSVANDTAPIHNGLLFLDKIMCQLPPPPPVNPDDLGEHTEDPSKSRRANFDGQTAEPACRGCHLLINPVSYAFDMYETAGRLRPSTDAKKYDARGEVKLSNGKIVTFANAVHMTKQLAREPQIVECHAHRWVEHFYGGPITGESACGMDRALAAVRAGGDLRTVIKAIILPMGS